MPDRKTLLCTQSALTGIDFIRVVDPEIQTLLEVHFIVDPTALESPLVDLAVVSAGPVAADPDLVSIISRTGGESIAAVTVVAAHWVRLMAPAGERTVLAVETAQPGDFSLYELRYDDGRVDRFFNGVSFSFKQGCPSDLDCTQEPDCPVQTPIDFPVDYLARDFTSFRNALLDFASQRYPEWQPRLEADGGVMLLEIMAALGDEFAYIQDRNAREAYLDTATQRHSLVSLARLVDYVPDPGTAATTDLAVGVAAGNGSQTAEAETLVWALPSGEEPIPFAVLERRLVDEAWNAIALHTPDAAQPCLEIGATEAFLATTEPLSGEQAWVGRPAILRSRPLDPSVPARAWRIVISDVEFLSDPLAQAGGIPLTRIAWGVDQALPFQLCQAETEVLLNCVPVIAGERLREVFRIGGDEALRRRYGSLDPAALSHLLALPRAVEREGPFDPVTQSRTVLLRYGLRASETRDLGWIGPDRPELTLREVVPDDSGGYLEDPAGLQWVYGRDVLQADDEEAVFSLEEGMWREVVVYQTPQGDQVFNDYAGNAGFSLRFGAGAFGRTPADGTIFEVSYRTGPAVRANLAADSVTQLTRPGTAPPEQPLAFAAWVTNPLPIDSGRAPEPAEQIRIAAPQAFRALPLRAVRPEDYQQIIERLEWVQRANAVTRWTGSWSTDIVTADERGSFSLDQDRLDELATQVDCVRQAGRAAQVEAPQFLSLDVEATVCVAPTAYPGEVKEQVIEALVGRRRPGKPLAFFDPDNFSFGQPLPRSALEAAIQAVPGVRGVERVRLRLRHHRALLDFDEAELAVAPSQILRCTHDPTRPEQGSVTVFTEGGFMA